MPKLNRDRIRDWLEEHNWSVQRLTEECNALTEDVFAEGTVRNAINGIDPMRPGRIRVIAKVTARHSDGIPYAQLIADAQPPNQDVRASSPETNSGKEIMIMRTEHLSVDTCVTIQGGCPAEYNICGHVVEFHFGGPRDGFHFAFDEVALRKLVALSAEAVAEWDASSTKHSNDPGDAASELVGCREGEPAT